MGLGEAEGILSRSWGISKFLASRRSLRAEQEDDHGGRGLDVREGVGRQGDLDLEEAGQGDETERDVERHGRQPGQQAVEEIALESLGDDEHVDGPDGDGGQKARGDTDEDEHNVASV